MKIVALLVALAGCSDWDHCNGDHSAVCSDQSGRAVISNCETIYCGEQCKFDRVQRACAAGDPCIVVQGTPDRAPATFHGYFDMMAVCQSWTVGDAGATD